MKGSARGVFSDVRVLEGSTETAIVSAEVVAPAFVTEGTEVSSSIPVVITVFVSVEVNAGEVVSVGLVLSTCVAETNKISGKVVPISSVMGD